MLRRSSRPTAMPLVSRPPSASLSVALVGLVAIMPTRPAKAQQPQASTAGDPRPLGIEEVVDFRSLPTGVAPVLSPDGLRLAYVVEGPQRTLARVDELLDERSEAWTELRVTDLGTGETRVVARNGWAPVWSPGGSALAYLVSDGGEVRLGLTEWTGDEWRTGSPDAGPLWATWMWTRPRWTPDGRHIVVKAVPAGRSTAEMLRRAAPAPPADEIESQKHHPGATVEVFRADDVRTDESRTPEAEARLPTSLPPWMRYAYGGDLVVVDVASGEVRRLTEGRTPMSWRVAPDGSSVAFLELDEVDGAGVDFRLVTVPMGSGEATVRARRIRQAFGRGMSWSPDGSSLAYLSGGDAEARGAWVVDPGKGSPRRIAELRAGWDAEVPPTWTADGRALLLAGSDTLWRVPVESPSDSTAAPSPLIALPGYRLGDLITPRTTDHRLPAADGSLLVRIARDDTGDPGFARVDARTGEVVAIHTEPGAFGGDARTDLSADGSVAVTWFATTRLAPEFWTLDPGLARSERLSRINPGFRPERLGEDRLVEWSSADGRTLAGTLLFPPGHDPDEVPAEPLPLIVLVYGGDSGTAALDSFDRHRQLLASRGWAVLVPSIPLDVGTPMEDHARAVLPAVDRLVGVGIADPGRIGITGHSYGGYGTLALLVQSDRFAAAVASAAQGDLVANYGDMTADGTDRMTWSEEGQGRMGGTLWEVPDRYRENSPVWRLDRVETPLLLLHGADDPTVPVWLAEAVFTGLRRLDRPVALARYAGEGHWWGDWSRANQIDYWTRLIAWFDRYMGPEEGG